VTRHPAGQAAAIVGLSVAATSLAAALPPFPDPSYGGSGDGIARIAAAAVPADSGYATHAVALADDRLVLVGMARTTAGGQDTRQLVLARLDARGLPDASFGADHDGIYRTAFFDESGMFSSDFETDVAQTGDGKLVYTGHSAVPTLIVGRLHADGTPDMDFSGNGHRLIAPSALVNGAIEGFFSTVLPLADGKTLLLGTVLAPPDPGQYFSCAMRLQADGSNDTSFGVASRTCIAPAQSAFSIAVAGRVLADGRVLLAGASLHSGGSGYDMSVARLGADGALDTNFGPDHDGWAFVAFDQGGALSDIAYAIAVDGAGRILLAGTFSGTNGSEDIGVARLLPDGQPDASFGSHGRVQVALDLGGSSDDEAHSVAALPGGGVLVGGVASGVDVALLLKPDGALDPRFGESGIYVQGPPNIYGYQQVLHGDYLYMVGSAGSDFAATRAVLPMFADGFENVDVLRPATLK
jgi:uncharacterized delta-60 repeat protein